MADISPNIFYDQITYLSCFDHENNFRFERVYKYNAGESDFWLSPDETKLYGAEDSKNFSLVKPYS